MRAHFTETTKREVQKDFVWGDILTLHRVGPYLIAEFDRNQASNVSDEAWAEEADENGQHIDFHPYVRNLDNQGWHDMGKGYSTLDEALVGAIVYRNEWANRDLSEAMNERLTGYIFRALGDPDAE